MKRAALMVMFAVLGLAAAPSRVADLNTSLAHRSSNTRQFAGVPGHVFFVADDRFGPQLWVNTGTPASSRRVTDSPSAPIVIASNEDGLLFSRSGTTSLFRAQPDGGISLLNQPALPAPASAAEFSLYGFVHDEAILNRCIRTPVLTCDVIAVRAGVVEARGPLVLALQTVSAGNLLVEEQGTRRWKLYDGHQFVTPILPLPGLAVALSETSAVYQAGQSLFIIDTRDGGVRALNNDMVGDDDRLIAASATNVLYAYNASTTSPSLFIHDIGGSWLFLDDLPVNWSTKRSGDRLFIGLFDRTARNGFEPWVVDMTDGGLTALGDLNGGGGNSTPHFFEATAQNRVLFNATDVLERIALWSTDGTLAGTRSLGIAAAADPASGGEFAGYPVDLGTERELGLSDGTPAGTSVVDLTPGTRSSSPELLALPRSVAMLANTSPDGSVSLLTVDLHDGGVTPWLTGSRAAFGAWANLDERVLISFATSESGQELWFVPTSDGGIGSLDLERGAASSAPADLTRVGPLVFFSAFTSLHGRELWVSDGTLQGTREVADLAPGPRSSSPSSLTAFDGGIVFAADDGVVGRELWRSDGTAIGTELVRDLSLGSSSSAPSNVLEAEGVVWFSANDGLWRSDGTREGTSVVVAAEATPRLARAGSVVFTATSAAGRELAITDGTQRAQLLLLGQQRVAAITAVGSAFYFILEEDGLRTLWRSEGTAVSTRAVRAWARGTQDWLFGVGDNVVFASVSDAGEELWQSDGTDAGTAMIAEVSAQRLDSWPGAPVQVGTRLVFAATDVNDDREPWQLVLDSAFDNSPPRIRGSVSGPQKNGWYVGQTTASFELDETDSAVTETSGCDGGTIDGEGTLTARCNATSTGGTASLELVIRRDVSPPLLTCPTAQTLQAEADGGITAEFIATAVDTVDPMPVVTSSPASGARFEIGRTPVNVTATDAAGHVSSCTFEVNVLAPRETAGADGGVNVFKPPRPCSCASSEGALGLLALVALERRARYRRLSV